MADAPLWYSYEETLALALAYLVGEFPDKATHRLSFLGHEARSLAQLIGALSAAQKQAYYDGIPAYQVDYDGIIRSRASRQALDNWAFIFGLPSNRGAGLYGRNGATYATGGQAAAIGIVGTFIPLSSQLSGSLGLVTTVVAAAIPLIGFTAVPVRAVTPGSAGNMPVGTKLNWQAPPVGLVSTSSLVVALTGGLDEETDLDLLARLLRRLQSPPKGGTAGDFRAWAEEATDSDGNSLSIVRAYVYPKRNGIGSVDVVPTVVGNGVSRDPGAVVAASLLAYLNARKVSTDTVRVIRPYFPPGQSLKLQVRIKPGVQYPFDWGGIVNTITLISYAGTAVVISGSIPPAGLKLSVDNWENGVTKIPPRIQVGITGYPVPRQRYVLGYHADTPIAGQCTLDVGTFVDGQPLLAGLEAGGFSHATGYSGSSAVEPIAQAVLDAINGFYRRGADGSISGWVEGVGASRQSGTADPADPWQDVVSVAIIAQAVLDLRDSGGAHLVVNSRDVGQVGAGPGQGITIAIGLGAFSALDFLTFDNVPGQGPQLPDPILVLVTP